MGSGSCGRWAPEAAGRCTSCVIGGRTLRRILPWGPRLTLQLDPSDKESRILQEDLFSEVTEVEERPYANADSPSSE